jgi:hypothetical protein
VCAWWAACRARVCRALPVCRALRACRLSRPPTSAARLVLDASYEATLLAAALDAAHGRGSGVVLLTLLGGGVFGNASAWIEDAIVKACVTLRSSGLRVLLVHHGRVDPHLEQRINSQLHAALSVYRANDLANDLSQLLGVAPPSAVEVPRAGRAPPPPPPPPPPPASTTSLTRTSLSSPARPAPPAASPSSRGGSGALPPPPPRGREHEAQSDRSPPTPPDLPYTDLAEPSDEMLLAALQKPSGGGRSMQGGGGVRRVRFLSRAELLARHPDQLDGLRLLVLTRTGWCPLAVSERVVHCWGGLVASGRPLKPAHPDEAHVHFKLELPHHELSKANIRCAASHQREPSIRYDETTPMRSGRSSGSSSSQKEPSYREPSYREPSSALKPSAREPSYRDAPFLLLVNDDLCVRHFPAHALVPDPSRAQGERAWERLDLQTPPQHTLASLADGAAAAAFHLHAGSRKRRVGRADDGRLAAGLPPSHSVDALFAFALDAAIIPYHTLTSPAVATFALATPPVPPSPAAKRRPRANARDASVAAAAVATVAAISAVAVDASPTSALVAVAGAAAAAAAVTAASPGLMEAASGALSRVVGDRAAKGKAGAPVPDIL